MSTSVAVPAAIAAALPSLGVVDITDEIAEAVNGRGSGIAYVSPGGDPSLIRVQERETGFFQDVECLLERLVPDGTAARERLVAFLLGPRTEQIPFTEGFLCLGQWQRVFHVSFDEGHRCDWTVTVLP